MISPQLQPSSPKFQRYLPVMSKFLLAQGGAMAWSLLSIVVSVPWVNDLAHQTSWALAVPIILGVAIVPGYLNALMVVSLLLDRQPSAHASESRENITILIAARNEGPRMTQTLQYIATQDYRGTIDVVVVDNGSDDDTAAQAIQAAQKFGVRLTCVREEKPGKNFALNTGLDYVRTDLVVTLDADTLLHRSALRYLVARYRHAPKDIAAVAGTVLVRNSRANLLTRIQEWDYFIGIAAIKRQQGLYQGTLVAQGAFSLYKTSVVRDIGGWPDAIGEDIVLTWKILRRGGLVYYEPLAVAFTEVPSTIQHFSRQRQRWARGMFEGIRAVKPWQQRSSYAKFLTGLDIVLPFIDVSYTIFWIPGLVLALYGKFWIVGPMTLLVLPLTLLTNLILYRHQRWVFKTLNLRVRKNILGFIAYVLFYQIIMSPISVAGYLKEVFHRKRVWA